MIEAGRVEETIYLAPAATAPGDEGRLTFGLVCGPALQSVMVRCARHEIAVVLPEDDLAAWARGEQVGIYATIDLGLRGALRVSVEKDFACLDNRDADNADTFPNPKAADRF